MFRKPRWADGSPISYRQDRTALGLHLWGTTSAVTVTVLWLMSSGWAGWWALIPVSITVSVGSELAARRRLRHVAAQTDAGRMKARLIDPLGWFDTWVAGVFARYADKYTARAAAAKARGDQAGEAKWLQRAERERGYSRTYERVVDRYGI